MLSLVVEFISVCVKIVLVRMPGQSGNLDETELPDLLDNYSRDGGLFQPYGGFEDGGSNTELRNPEAIVRTMPFNKDFGDNDWDNRYELQCFYKFFRNQQHYKG